VKLYALAAWVHILAIIVGMVKVSVTFCLLQEIKMQTQAFVVTKHPPKCFTTSGYLIILITFFRFEKLFKPKRRMKVMQSKFLCCQIFCFANLWVAIILNER